MSDNSMFLLMERLETQEFEKLELINKKKLELDRYLKEVEKELLLKIEGPIYDYLELLRCYYFSLGEMSKEMEGYNVNYDPFERIKREDKNKES